MTKKNLLAAWTVALAVLAGARPGHVAAQTTLQEQFTQLSSDEARPWTFWYWMFGAVTREGITADLEAMKRVGLGGAYLMPIKSVAQGPQFGGKAEQLSPEWWDMVRFSMEEADRLGLELGGAHVSPAHAAAILRAGEPDFVIGSVHNKSEALGGGDFYFVQYDSPELCHEMLADYFQSLLAVAELGLYDSLGHIIYPLRYMAMRDGQDVTLEPHLPVLRDILTAVADRGKGIEVNTYRGRTVAEWRETLALYRSLGGEKVTVGSDAHRPGDVGLGAAQSLDLLRELGFRAVTVYRRREPRSIPL